MNEKKEQSMVNNFTNFRFENQAQYMTILKAIPGILFIFDSSGKYLDFFTNEISQLASSPDGIIGKKLSDFFSESQSKIFLELFGKALETGEIQTAEYEMLIDSKTKHFETRIVPFEEKKLLTFVRDITPIKKSHLVREATHKISEAVSSSHSLNELFAIVHRETRTVLTANNFYIALYDKEDNTLNFPYFVDEVDSPPEGREKLGKGLTEYVIRTGKSLLATPEVFNKLVTAGEVEIVGEPSIDWLGVPLIADNVTFGVMVVQTYTEGVRYTQEDKEYLEVIASQAATSIKRKQSEEELLLSESTYTGIIDSVNEAIYIQDENGRFLTVNRAAEKMYGYPREFFIEKTPDFLSAPDKNDIGLVVSALQKAFDGKPQIFEFWGLKKDGTVFPKEVSLSPGTFFGKKAVVAVARDVTERKEAEDNLRKSEERYRLLADNIGDIIFTLDMDMFFKYISPSIKVVTGYEMEEVIKKHFSELLTEHSYRNVEIAIKEEFHKHYFAAEGEVIPNRIIELEIIKKNKVITWVEVKTSFLRDERGKIFGILGVARDITLRKHAEQEIIRAKEKAEEISRLKTNFLSNMSHELRTPLVSILGSAEILTQEIVDPQLKKWAHNILVSGKRLLETQNLILDLSKIEAEKIEIVYSIISVADAIKEVVSLFEPLAFKKGLKLKLSLDSKDISARLDERLVREVLNNLVNNAIKYTEKGSIIVEMRREDNFAVISVKDTGIGIPKEKIPIIFEEFRQVSEGRNRSFEGTGLGLTITKRFVGLLKGTIEVESELGKGTEFIVKLPIGKIGSKTTVRPSIDKSSMDITRHPKIIDHVRKVLLVEDDLINANLIFYYLKAQYNVTVVGNGSDAIKKSKGDDFDIILMDINLGRGMNGLEATRQIRSIPGYKKTPVVAITAFAMQGDKEEFLANGCTHYISKPFEKNDLLQLLLRIEAEISG